MKIAVLYSGQLRTFFKNIENHKDNLLNVYDCDVYASFWNIVGHGNVFHRYSYSESDVIKDEEINEIVKVLNPKDIEFEDYLSGQSNLSNFKYANSERLNNHCINVISMHYKVKKAFLLLEKSNIKYDGIFRIRPDLFFKNKLQLSYPKENTIYTSLEHRWNLGGGGVNDQIAFSDFNTMKKYSNFIDHWDSFSLEQEGRCSPEPMLKKYLEYQKINIEEINNNEPLHDILRNE